MNFQIFLTDKFLGGEFTKYGTEVLNFPYEDPEDRVDPMSRIFPRVIIFHSFVVAHPSKGMKNPVKKSNQ